MNRRTFVLLAGAASAVPLRVSGAMAGRLRLSLDAQRRWSLSYIGAGPFPSTVLLPPTPLSFTIGGRTFSLADLEDTAVAQGRPPDGQSTIVRGRAAGVFVEAELWTGPVAAAAVATLAVRIYPDTETPAVSQIHFLDAPLAPALGGAGVLSAWTSGYQSWSGAALTPLADDTSEIESHFVLALSRGARALALGFEPGDAGEGRFAAGSGRLTAISRLEPARPVPPGGERALLRLAYTPPPIGDTGVALESLLLPVAEADRERLRAVGVPAGWCSWYELGAAVTQDAVLENLEVAARQFDPRYLRYFQLDDGFQRAAGDWEVNAKFPAGHRGLTDRIRAKGFRPGLWLAPFAVAERSAVAAAHPDWLLTAGRDGGEGPAVLDTRDQWGGRIFGLDGAHPGVQEWLAALARRVSREWGYEYVKLDFLYYATRGARHFGGATHAEALRAGLRAFRQGLAGSPSVFVLGCGAPLQACVGLVDGMRIGPDVDATWGGVQGAARAAQQRAPFHRTLWLNDPDCLVVRPPLTVDEARAWASVVAASGGLNLLSDHLPALPAERFGILRRTLPVSPVAGHPIAAGRGRAALWLTRGRPDWSTLVAVNWADEPAVVDLPLARLGLPPGTALAYDVWRGVFDGAVTDRWRAEIPARACRVVAFRPRRPRPQLLGTGRHLIQAAVDVAEETWHAAERTLAVKSVNLDGRTYDATLAVPGSYRVAAVDAPVAAKLWRDGAGVARVSLEPGALAEVDWSVRFSVTSSR